MVVACCRVVSTTRVVSSLSRSKRSVERQNNICQTSLAFSLAQFQHTSVSLVHFPLEERGSISSWKQGFGLKIASLLTIFSWTFQSKFKKTWMFFLFKHNFILFYLCILNTAYQLYYFLRIFILFYFIVLFNFVLRDKIR